MRSAGPRHSPDPVEAVQEERPGHRRIEEQPRCAQTPGPLAIRHRRRADPPQPAVAAGVHGVELLHTDEETHRVRQGLPRGLVDGGPLTVYSSAPSDFRALEYLARSRCRVGSLSSACLPIGLESARVAHPSIVNAQSGPARSSQRSLFGSGCEVAPGSRDRQRAGGLSSASGDAEYSRLTPGSG